MANSVLPPAGTSSLQHHRMPNGSCIVPDHQSGIDFLSSSHFTLSQDPSSTKHSMKSTFRRDYIPWQVDGRPHGSLDHPTPADVLLKDVRYFNQRESETKNAYNNGFIEKPVVRDVSEQLRQTNFKMDKDPRFSCFSTTHNIDFTPKEIATNTALPVNPMKSCIPQGDPDKAQDPVSDYRDRFRGHDICSHQVKKASGMQPGAGMTIQGDDRQRNFTTSHVDDFRGNTLPKLDAIKKPTGTNIPLGDPTQVKEISTIQQISYQPYSADQMNVYNKSAMMGKHQETNYKQNDGHNKWSTYLSTMADCYRPVEGGPRTIATTQRNLSQFPGDENQHRNGDRANMTSNRFHYGNPAPTVKPEIISGKDRSTQSNVLFGKPELGDQFYETTTDSTFKPVSAPSTPYKSSGDMNTRSTVPLKYYGDEINGTTYMGDFHNHQTGAMNIHECALEKLKGSHIKAPLGKDMQFSTEHLDQFTEKDGKGKSNVDTGKLQRSSVPLGTLYQH